MIYYQLDKRVQIESIKDKALLEIEKIERVAEKMLSSLKQRRSDLQLDEVNKENLRLSRINGDVNAENANLNTLVTTIQNNFTTAKNQIATLEDFKITANGQLVRDQRRINSLDSDVATLRWENQNLRTDTAARIDELQRQNAQALNAVRTESADHLASVYLNHHALFDRLVTRFENRERETALKQEEREGRAIVKQLVERGIEKALRSEQEEKISNLGVNLARKSAAFEILQMEHDQMSERIGQKFDVMTQAMARNPTESPVSELLRSNDQQNVSSSESENDADFIEVVQEM